MDKVDRQFSLENNGCTVTFTIRPLNAETGFQMQENIRKALADGASKADFADPSSWISSLLSLQPSFVDSIRSKLFAHIDVKVVDDAGERTYNHLNSEAFADVFHVDKLGTMKVYDVMMKALEVNFLSCLPDAWKNFMDSYQDPAAEDTSVSS